MTRTNFINFTIGTKSICWKITPLIIFSLVSLNITFIATAFFVGTQMNSQQSILSQAEFPDISRTLEQQNSAIHRAKLDAEKNIDILGSKLGVLQHQVIRLNALGQRLSHQYKIDEIDFSEDSVAIGGGVQSSQTSFSVTDFVAELQQLEDIIKKNNDQLTALNSLLANKSLAKNTHPSIMPIKAYVSSWYGWRSDPMKKHSRRSFHEGMDFSADVGTGIKSVADGIVSWSGPKDQYGNFVEIDHGNGYVTRYGHIDELFVKVGQRVSKGQQIASVGMTGRTTGPHLHFEVQKDGQHLDPKNFMKLN